MGGASRLAFEQLVKRERIKSSVVVNTSKFRSEGWNWHETWSGASMLPDPDPDPEPELNGVDTGLSLSPAGVYNNDKE